MLSQLPSIFFNVVTPVFALVLCGYLLGPRLELQYRTLSRTAYYLMIPAFVFNVMSSIRLDPGTAGRMVAGISLIYLATGFMALVVARLMGANRETSIAFLMTAIFGNVGNYGLALAQFRLGPSALPSATVYMVTVNTLAFIVCVLAAGWVRDGGYGAVKNVFKTPGIVALPIALIFPICGLEPPVMVRRITGLLGDAMIPMMLLTLGLQLREAGRLQWDPMVLAASAVRLVAGALLAFTLIPLIGLSGLESSTGILQSSMPTAVLTAIIAMEYDLKPIFVTSIVFTTTLFSLLSLTVVMTLL